MKKKALFYCLSISFVSLNPYATLKYGIGLGGATGSDLFAVIAGLKTAQIWRLKKQIAQLELTKSTSPQVVSLKARMKQLARERTIYGSIAATLLAISGVTAAYAHLKDKPLTLLNQLLIQYINEPTGLNNPKALLTEAHSKLSSADFKKFINKKTSRGKTPLHTAAEAEGPPGTTLSTTPLLLNFNEIKVNEKDSHGNTPLHFAVEYQNIPMIRLLLDKKANCKAENNNKETPLGQAQETKKAYEKILKSDAYDPETKAHTQKDLETITSIIDLLTASNAS